MIDRYCDPIPYVLARLAIYGAGPLAEQGGGLLRQMSYTPSFSIKIITTWSKYEPAGADWATATGCLEPDATPGASIANCPTHPATQHNLHKRRPRAAI